MVEAGASGVTEQEILDALDIAHGEIKKLVAAMEELQQKAGKEKIEVEAPSIDEALLEEIRSSYGAKIDEATSIKEKLARQDAADAVKKEVLEALAPAGEDGEVDEARRAEVKAAFSSIEKDIIRKRDRRRQEAPRRPRAGRDPADRVRGRHLPARARLGAVHPRRDPDPLQRRPRHDAHGHAPRHARAGRPRSGSGTTTTSRPSRSGRRASCAGPKRRDIGHGALAERALAATIPDEEDFPYVIRAVSETLESNGSSSMGSVCASSMALQAAGVPVSAPVAGVAMGLIKEGDDYIVLTDIAGVEDHLGDMDFKVAGTADGITALQMDIKITGVTFEILTDALEQANKGRQFILGKMAEAIDGPREKLSQHAPRDRVDQDRPREDRRRDRQRRRNDSRSLRGVRSGDRRRGRRHGPHLRADRLPGRGVRRPDRVDDQGGRDRRHATTRAKVVKTTTFGAFVELVKGTDGLLHISNVKPGERVDSVDDVLTAGEEIDVTVVEVDKERGRIGLRLSDDPSVEGKSPEELAAVGSGGGERNGGDRGEAAAAATAAGESASDAASH